MNYKRTTVTLSKEIDIEVVYPVDLGEKDVALLIRKIDPSDWDMMDWNVTNSTEIQFSVPSEQCKVKQTMRYGGVRPEAGYFEKSDLLVVDDKRANLVLPEEATWWIATEEDEKKERQQEFNPAQLLLFPS